MRSVRMRPETKFRIVSQVNEEVVPSGTLPLPLTSLLVEGVGQGEYIGQVVSPRLIQVNATFRTDTLGVGASIRWYVVQWLVDDSLDPFTVTKYRPSTNVNGFADYAIRTKFRTLKKGQFALNRYAPADVADNRASKVLTFSIRPRANVTFTNTGVGVLQKNHIFFFATSDVSANPPLLQIMSRMLYTDS